MTRDQCPRCKSYDADFAPIGGGEFEVDCQVCDMTFTWSPPRD